jgi:uncharacterized membrane protein
VKRYEQDRIRKKDARRSPISLAAKPQFVSEETQKQSEPQKNEHAPVTFSAFSGPIPPPHFLVEYEKMVPGIAKRFLEEPHIEAEHRRSIERTMAQEQVRLAKRGQIMAFLVANVCVFGARGAIFLGYSLEGLGALIASIGAFTGVWFYVKKRQ